MELGREVRESFEIRQIAFSPCGWSQLNFLALRRMALSPSEALHRFATGNETKLAIRMLGLATCARYSAEKIHHSR